jgi:hypothetical protein
VPTEKANAKAFAKFGVGQDVVNRRKEAGLCSSVGTLATAHPSARTAQATARNLAELQTIP